MLAAVALAVPLSAWATLFPTNTWLQVAPVVLLLLLAYWALRRWPASDASAGFVTALVLLQLFASRWFYSFVPYDARLGGGIDAAFGSKRNMFDRVVHFLFGALALPPIMDLGGRHWGLSRRTAVIFAVKFVLAVGEAYEVFECCLTLALSPADAGAYKGEQGDMFHAQKDMAMARLGALLAISLAGRFYRKGRQ